MKSRTLYIRTIRCLVDINLNNLDANLDREIIRQILNLVI